MQEFDFRVSNELVENANATIDRLSSRELIKLSKVAENIYQTQKQDQIKKAKEYFDVAILPLLKDFAEMSGSLLYIEERDEKGSIQAIFKNSAGFDITESCKLMRNAIFVSNAIGIMSEENESVLSLVYDYNEMI